MSLYVLIHLRGGDIEAAFVFPKADVAITAAIDYARRSGFFLPEDGESERFGIRDLKDDNYLVSDVNDDDRLIIKRAFTVEGSFAMPKTEGATS